MLFTDDSQIFEEIQQELSKSVRRMRDTQHLDFHAIAMRLGIEESEARELYAIAISKSKI